jgi:hypothetical protein
MLRGESLLAGRLSAATTAASLGFLMDANGYTVASDTTSTSFGAAEPTDTLGLKGQAQTFRGIAAIPVQGQFRILVRVPWTLTTQSAGAPTRGTIAVGVSIGGVVVVALAATGPQGAPRNLNSANGTRFVELIAVDMPAIEAIAAGTAIDILVQPLVTVVSGVGGSTMETTLRHDPSAVDDQLALEFQGIGN